MAMSESERRGRWWGCYAASLTFFIVGCWALKLSWHQACGAAAFISAAVAAVRCDMLDLRS
jgi:hypothetical protein